MSNNQVTRFNHIVGNAPAEDMDEWWKQVTLQARLVLEEAQEQYDAAIERDIVEVVDGAMDVTYVQAYMDDLLKHKGVDTRGAFQAVCDNNNSKFTQSLSYAENSLEGMMELDGVIRYIESVNYDGEEYHIVKRKNDGKVLKLLGHIPPQLSDYIPEELLNNVNS